MKRLFDFFLSTLLFILFSPVTIGIAIAVRMKLGSPVIFKQQRPGLNGKPFYLYKFRTMTDLKDIHGQLLPDHLRLTSLGRFLRKFSLDELLQLVNVMKGDISIVGPRPLLMEYLALYTEEQRRRHDVKPGITGWAQVNGRNGISWEDKFKLDIWYVNHHSFLLDIKILFLTVFKVFISEGISQPGEATVKAFKGSRETVRRRGKE